MLYKGKRLINTPYPPLYVIFPVHIFLRCLQQFERLKEATPGGLPYERGGDARRKFWTKPLEQTNLGVAQPFLTPKRDLFKLWLHESSKYNELKIYIFLYFFTCNPERALRLNIMAFCPEHLKWDQNPKFSPLIETASIPAPFTCFIWEFRPGRLLSSVSHDRKIFVQNEVNLKSVGAFNCFFSYTHPRPLLRFAFQPCLFSTSFPGSLPWLGENPGNVVGLFCVLLFTVISGYFVTVDNPVGSWDVLKFRRIMQ